MKCGEGNEKEWKVRNAWLESKNKNKKLPSTFLYILGKRVASLYIALDHYSLMVSPPSQRGKKGNERLQAQRQL
jgi:hypothetical protein